MLDAEAFINRNTPGIKLGGHRRIHVLIRTGDVITSGFEHTGQTTHGRAATGDEVNVMRCFEDHVGATPNSCITKLCTSGRNR